MKKFTPKKFLFVSWESLSGDLAWQAKKEGNKVKVYIKIKRDQDVFDGFVDKVNNWEKEVDWADVVIFDDVGFGKWADALRKKGKLVIGGSIYTDKLEGSREFGQAEMKKAGMVVLPHWDFSDFNLAIRFLRKNPGRYVFKPNYGVGEGLDLHDLLFLGEQENGKDILEMLETNKKLLKSQIKSFQLQRFAGGVEMAVGAFFNGEDFIHPINVNFEHKRLFPGELGPFTGEMGTLMYWSKPNTLFNNTLARMTDSLRKSGYVGYIDINCIVNERGIFPLEFTSRFGYPTINIQLEGILTPAGEFLYRLANKEKFELKTKTGFQVGIVACLTPYGTGHYSDIFVYRNMSILFRKPNPKLEGIHLGDVKLINGQLRVAGASGYVLIVTGAGQTVEEAREQAYDRIGNIRMQNMFYRNDIGMRWFKERGKLKTWGYL
ncbi:MAG: phosphoribosylglycinamide synthetase C domain-containing protein [bacterium]|nr:phosphoribosylglycinamide synthetase C domain-containing protein [bacterium]